MLGVLAGQPGRIVRTQVLDALHRLGVELHPVALAVGIDEAESVAAKAMLEPIAIRNAAVGEQNGDLVQGFRRQAPEIPLRGAVAHVGARIALLCVDEVRKLARVLDEEYRGVDRKSTRLNSSH